MKLRILTTAIIAVCALSVPAQAAQNRVLESEIDATGLTQVRLQAKVGDVIVAAVEGDVVRVEATLSPRRGGFFSSLKAAEREVREAELVTTVSGGVLTVHITGDDDRRFEEDWALILPPGLMFELELGVGEVSITGLRAGVELEVGVGNVELVLGDGPIDLDVGVGNVVARSQAGAYRSVAASSGVGAALIEAGGARITGQGFVGHSAEWDGDGRHDIDAATGVGDVRIVLE